MYNIFFSRIEEGVESAKDTLSKIIDSNSKVAILPWAFPLEIDGYKLENEFFKKGEKRYLRYIDSLKKIGINEENVTICNCYNDSKEELKQIISNSDILLLPGGNPEMFFSKVVHHTGILYDIKNFSNIIIGESAGAELQLTRYFITAKNNYYKYFAFYDGFGILNDPFYLDVHSINNKFYLNKIQKVADTTNKNVYAIFDNGCIIYNRKTEDIKLFGDVKTITPTIDNDKI